MAGQRVVPNCQTATQRCHRPRGHRPLVDARVFATHRGRPWTPSMHRDGHRSDPQMQLSQGLVGLDETRPVRIFQLEDEGARLGRSTREGSTSDYLPNRSWQSPMELVGQYRSGRAGSEHQICASCPEAMPWRKAVVRAPLLFGWHSAPRPAKFASPLAAERSERREAVLELVPRTGKYQL